MKSFKISTTNFNKKGLPIFLKGGLDFAQLRFVSGCEKAFKKQERTKPTAKFNFAAIGYETSEDFAAFMIEARDVAEAQHEFNKVGSPNTGPQVGDVFTIQDFHNTGGEIAARMANGMNEDGVWVWWNAGATFQRKGNEWIVVDTLEVA
jgi:hypothetical protein